MQKTAPSPSGHALAARHPLRLTGSIPRNVKMGRRVETRRVGSAAARVAEGGGRFALVAAPGCRRSPRAARPETRRVVVVITGADGRCHAARELGAGEDVVAYQTRAAVRQKRACPDDAPRRARVPEGEASAGSEPAPGTVPPLTAAGTTDAAREPPAPPTPSAPPTPPTRAAAIPLPNPGCSARSSSPANRLRRWCRPG